MELDESFLQSSGGRSLAWLADAPMFIDSDQVSALYNAVAKPEHETEKITLNVEDSKEFKGEGKAGVEGHLGVAEWLSTIFPFLKAEATVTGEVGGSATVAKKDAREIELRPVNTPQRQLVQLALHYWVNLPHRTRAVLNPTDPDWLEENFVAALPRSLVFVEFPPETAFVPMAAEVDAGNVRVIYPDLVKSFVGPKDRDNVPSYPEPAYYKEKPDQLKEKREKYWRFFKDHFSSLLATEAIENRVGAGGLIRWIAYRVPLGDALPCLHLHVSPQARYDTGTFAYRLVKRGYKHGLRVVGTLKSEPGMNVLAIFER